MDRVSGADRPLMASSQRRRSDRSHSQTPALTGSSKRLSVLPCHVLAGALLFAAGLAVSHGQSVGDGTGQRSSTTAFFTIGGENSQLPAYADNAMGFDLGLSTQPHPLLGLEVRVGAYPISAQYVQIPFTAGYRVAGRTFFGFPYEPFAYVGGGISRSQDENLGHSGYSPQWVKCWQANVGLDRDYGAFSWRIVQVDYRRTYEPVHVIRSLGLSTGVVYRFKR
jgi:hypothetical protein